MRFYSRQTGALYLNALTAVIWSGLVCFGHHRSSLQVLVVALYVFQFAFTVAGQLFTYWEFHPDGLYERRFWRKRTIPFDQMAAMKSESPAGKPAPNWVKIFFTSPFPYFDTDQNAMDRGTLTLAPAHRSELLITLRHAAPQASFETL